MMHDLMEPAQVPGKRMPAAKQRKKRLRSVWRDKGRGSALCCAWELGHLGAWKEARRATYVHCNEIRT